jgi:transcriptional antiterminator RfaH
MIPEQIEQPAAWFCLVAQPKCEHLAAAQLAERQGLKVFAPRIRFRRPNRGKGPIWTTEALFPGYFFANVDPAALRQVHHAPNVRGIVHFGDSWPSIPDQTIEELIRTVGEAEIHIIDPELSAGDQVKIVEGNFQGFEAVVARVMPARERIAVLLDFLGRQTVVELENAAVVKGEEQRQVLFRAG